MAFSRAEKMTAEFEMSSTFDSAVGTHGTERVVRSGRRGRADAQPAIPVWVSSIREIVRNE